MKPAEQATLPPDPSEMPSIFGFLILFPISPSMVDWKSLAQLSLGSGREEGHQPGNPDGDVHQILKVTVNTESQWQPDAP